MRINLSYSWVGSFLRLDFELLKIGLIWETNRLIGV